MADRLDLQRELETRLGSKNVYYDPPESLKMQYDAIRYSKSNMLVTSADNQKWSTYCRYELIHISKKPDSKVIDKLLELPYCSYDRHYVADNMHHDVLTIYW